MRLAVAAVCAALGACAPQACSDRTERHLARAVELLVGEPGPLADQAEEALVAAGADAILYLETGLYDADWTARRRIVRALVRIGDGAAAPILAHLARRDPHADVRHHAAAGLAVLERVPLP